MSAEQLTPIQKKGILLMEEGYTCAEATLHVLLEEMGWDDAAYQWAAAGFWGAGKSGKSTCGILFGATVFLGYLHGLNANQLPDLESEGRTRAVASVEKLYQGFIDKFGDTDCYKLTGCDWSNRKDIVKYFKEEVYTGTCYIFMEYVLAQSMEQIKLVNYKST